MAARLAGGAPSNPNPNGMPDHEQQEEDFDTENYAGTSLSFPGVASLLGMLDCRIACILRDGRHITGVLTSYDQFANLVLTGTKETLMAGAGTLLGFGVLMPLPSPPFHLIHYHY